MPKKRLEGKMNFNWEDLTYKEAIIDYDKVISLNPKFLEAHLNKAISLKNIKKC